MDVTAIRDDSYSEGRIFEEILPHSDTKSIAVLLDKKSKNIKNKEDALSAVKLDPAVLEAQVTIDTRSENEHSTPLQLPKKTKDEEHQRRFDFERAMCLQRAALMSLSGQQLGLLMRYVDTLRTQRQSTQRQLECAFCKNNGHPEVWYATHALRDGRGRVRCPALRALSCRRCGATGDTAHTDKYCPKR